MTPVTAAVSAVVFRNEDNGYTVLRCDGADKKGFSAVGSMPDVLRGETLEMTGEWSTHKQYGEQFTVAEYKRYAPTGSDAIYSFLSSGAIRGVGQGLAKAIVVKFGERTFEVIEESPERLSEIRGITPKLAREIAVEMRRTAGLRRLSEFLSKFEVTALVCARLYREYGTESEAAVRENPYILLAPEVGGKFRSAELLRESLGFPADTPERIEAAVLYEMRHNLPNGHVFIPADALVEATAVFLRGRGDAESVGADAVAEAIVGMCEEGIIVREEIGGDDACYLPEMHAAETYIAETLRSARTPAEGGTADDAVNVDVDALIAELEAREGVLYAELQREAVRAAAKSRVTVLTGGPGTGKTTSLRAILALYDKMGLQTLLCAPTGRAAKRMSELCGRDGAV
ncbi:MAG: ATP-dependent RecD-like DNA helicase, partial [Oscillospiraceae bacterium]|nr:ATP-dependent RecD-like DNA helicase [Oscillospiraceae bacterium]